MGKELPKGWVEVTISQMVSSDGKFNDGDWVESKDQDPEGSVRLIQLADIGTNEFRDRSDRFLNIETALKLRCSFLEKGDILIARMPDPIGRACLFPLEGKNVTVVDVAFIRTGKKGANPKWLMYIINSPEIKNQIEGLASGTTRQRISRKNLDTIKFPLPPKPQQDRIVAKLDQLFADLERIKVGLAKIPVLMKNFRHAVLTQAVTGKLTEEWRVEKKMERVKVKNKNTHIELYNSQLEGLLPSNWLLVRADDITEKITDGEHQTPKRIENGRMLLSAKNVRSGYIDYDNYDCISQEDFDKCLKRCQAEKGDVLIVSVGATIGRTSIIRSDIKFALVRSVALLKPSKNILGEYLMHVLQSRFLQDVIMKVSQGSAQSCLYINKIMGLPIPLPTLYEQQEIVRRIEALFAQADAIEARYKLLKEKIEYLPQAILAKAFKGELVEQLPSDGDARELLEEIKKMKAGLAKGEKKEKV